MKGFGLLSPDSVEEASSLLKTYGDAALVCAGGTELILLLKMGLASPSLLLRLDRLGLHEIEDDGTLVRFGAGVTHVRASASDAVHASLPLLSQTLAIIANPRVRACGTLGGSLCFAEPHSDVSTLLLLYDASVVLSTGSDERRVAMGDFVTGMLTTSRRDHEILTAIEVPRPHPGVEWGYARFVIGERPNVTVACTVEVQPSSGHITDARVVVGCAGPAPVRVPLAEETLNGVALDDPGISEVASAAGAACATECEVYDEEEISAWYKRKLVQVMARRVVAESLGKVSKALETSRRD